MPDLSKILLFRMVHIANMPYILKHGLRHKHSVAADPDFVSIGDASIISKRDRFVLPNGKKLGDYIPFYFGVRMPMLYVIQKGFGVESIPAKDIIYCISNVQNMIDNQLDFVFSNGHAIDALSSFYEADAIDNISNLIDIKAINSKYWKDQNDLDLKRRKEAEFLIEKDIPIDAIDGYAVYNANVKQALLDLGVQEDNIFLSPDFYF
jgi:hypothetical protein